MKFMTTEEAAAFLSVAPGTMKVWRTRSAGPKYLKMNRLVRYTQKDLEAFVKKSAKVKR